MIYTYLRYLLINILLHINETRSVTNGPTPRPVWREAALQKRYGNVTNQIDVTLVWPPKRVCNVSVSFCNVSVSFCNALCLLKN